MSGCSGTAASYARGCRCQRCLAADKARVLVRERAGNPPYRPPGKARRRAEELARAGLSKRRICEQSGLSHATLTRLLADPPPERILDRTERALMAVRPVTPPWAYVDAGPARELLTALRRRGYSLAFVSASAGVCVKEVARGRRFCRRRTEAAIEEFAAFAGNSPGVALDRKPNGRRGGLPEQPDDTT